MKKMFLSCALFIIGVVKADTVIIRQPGLVEAVGTTAVGLIRGVGEFAVGTVCGSTTVVQSSPVAVSAPLYSGVATPSVIVPAQPVVCHPVVVSPVVLAPQPLYYRSGYLPHQTIGPHGRGHWVYYTF